MFRRLSPLVIALLFWTVTVTPAAPLDPAVVLDRPVLNAGEPAQIHILVRFDVPEAAPAGSAERPPLHFALVIDRSGSMESRGKLEFAKVAARTLTAMLAANDHLAVVEYDDRITVLWPSSPAGSPELVDRLIDGLTPRSSTNLAGGLSAGISEILRDRGAGRIERVVLLSDGLANTGITHPARIAALAAEARSQGVAVTTMGLGLDYDEDLMQAVAQRGGGRYYYIENPSEMARLYRQEMGKVLQQTTRDFALWFEPAPMVREVKVYGYPVETDGDRSRIMMEDLYSGDSRVALLALALGNVPVGDLEIGRIGLRYTDVEDGLERSQSVPVRVTGTSDRALAARSVNPVVATESVMIVADQQHADAVRVFESGDKATAVAQIDRIRTEVTAAHQLLGDPKLKKKLEALDLERQDMDRAEIDPEYRKGYLKQRKEAFYGSTRGKRGKYLLEEKACGPEVEDLQRTLHDLGLYDGPMNGCFGPELRLAVEAYQRTHNLEIDGIAGPGTLRSLGLF